MKILNREQLYEADRKTLEAEGIPSEVLMERAATMAFDWLHKRLEGAPVRIHIFCGIGNNGGDGLVIGRLLREHGYEIRVYVVKYSDYRSDDFMTNLKRLKDGDVWPEYLEKGSPLPEIQDSEMIVDAVFGIGLNRPFEPWVGMLFDHLNNSGAFILGVDMPSGLQMDRVPEQGQPVLRADMLLTFGAPKLIFFLPQTGENIKQWETLDIGLDPAYISGLETDHEVLSRTALVETYRPRKKFSHKGSYGHALILGGRHGKIGAVALAAQAALVSGAGLVTACVPGCGYIPLQAQLPEIMVLTTAGEKVHGSFPDRTDGYVIGVGMGLGTSHETQSAFLEWLAKQQHPLLLDADALNILSQHPEAHQHIPKSSILTPHPGELKRLIGEWEDDFEKLKKAKDFVLKSNCILIIKGAHTLILNNSKTYVNVSGNPGMATAGSGDVLCGMITALLAQGYAPLEAALMGVYMHGRAGDLQVRETGYEGLTAMEIIKGIPKAFQEFYPTEGRSGSLRPE